MRNYDDVEVLVTATIASAPYMAAARDYFERGLLDEAWLAGEPSSSVRDAAQSGVTIAGSWWPAADLCKIRDHLPYVGVRALLDLCAERAGDWVGKAEADAAAQATPRQLASELSALTKFVRRELRRDDWPIEYRKVANTYSYRMSPEAAAIWHSGTRTTPVRPAEGNPS